MAGLAVRESVTLAGRAERARAARTFVGEVLGPGHPCRDDAALLVSEIFGNSVRHSGSATPGETVTVAVIAGDGIVRVEVTDRAGPGTPELRPAGRDAEGGRGLQLVNYRLGPFESLASLVTDNRSFCRMGSASVNGPLRHPFEEASGLLHLAYPRHS